MTGGHGVHGHPSGPDRAPDDARYCPRCATALETRDVADTRRRVCPACGLVHFRDPKVAVGAVVINDGRLLLVRRVMQPEAGRWSLPAGFLDAGEDPRDAAARETLEEAGVVVRVGELLDLLVNPPGGATLFLVFAATLVSGETRAGDDADAAAFFGPAELPELAFESTRAAVSGWLSGRRGEPGSGVVRTDPAGTGKPPGERNPAGEGNSVTG